MSIFLDYNKNKINYSKKLALIYTETISSLSMQPETVDVTDGSDLIQICGKLRK